MNIATTPEEIIETTRRWLEKAVIGLNLCPFATSVHVKNQIRYVVSHARDLQELYRNLEDELLKLQQAAPEEIDTTLLIHPWILNDFLDYNEFIEVAEACVAELDLEGEIQIASFHPQYQFAGTQVDDIENYTNRAPYPMLHLLRETSIARALQAFPDASDIYLKNIETMKKLGHAGWQALNIASPVREADKTEK